MSQLKAYKLQEQIDELNKQLEHHQEKVCKHKNATGKRGSNTGNYDPGSDCYWIDAECPTCLKRWHIDGDDPEYREFSMKYMRG